MGAWSRWVFAAMVSAGACGRSAPTTQAADRAPVPATPIDAVAAIDAPDPPGLDVALEGNVVCLHFRDANKLVVAVEQFGSPKGVHEVDAGTGIGSHCCSPMTRRSKRPS